MKHYTPAHPTLTAEQDIIKETTETDYIAVLDTETNWYDEVMSVGIVIADAENYSPIDSRYFIIYPEFTVGGMYANQLFINCKEPSEKYTRESAIEEIRNKLSKYNVTKVFAYNAKFDKSHLPELDDLCWYDIMRMAAYRQYNPYIPACAECCKTGRLKRGYKVDDILKMIRGTGYRESHNAVQDALDELEIMKHLNHPLEEYGIARL